jgi:hypothetical protein
VIARSLALALALAAFAPAARADVVKLKDGRTIEGVVEQDGDSLVVVRRLGAVRVPREDVASVEVRETPEQELARRVLALQPGDHAAALDLARFCANHEFTDEARSLARHVQREAPAIDGLAALWDALDFHQVDGEWVAPEVYYPANGWEKLSGRWTPPEEVRVFRASRGRRDAERALEVARADAARVERGSRDAERGLERARLEVDNLEAAGPALEAARVAADAALRAREADLRYAEDAAREARLRYDGWVVLQRGADDCAWETRRVLLWSGYSRCDRDVDAARRARDAALAHMQQVAADAVRLPERLAAARGDLRRAEADHAAAADALAAARLALTEAEDYRAEVELELSLAKAARDLARQGR